MCAHCTESEARGCLAYNATYVKEYCGGANPGCLRCMHDKAECSYSSLHQMRSPSDKVSPPYPVFYYCLLICNTRSPLPPQENAK